MNKFLNTIDKKNYFKIMNKISRYNDEMVTDYVYSFIRKDDKVVFTSTSYKSEEWNENKYKDDFLVYYKDATSQLKSIFYNPKISYETSKDNLILKILHR